MCLLDAWVHLLQTVTLSSIALVWICVEVEYGQLCGYPYRHDMGIIWAEDTLRHLRAINWNHFW